MNRYIEYMFVIRKNENYYHCYADSTIEFMVEFAIFSIIFDIHNFPLKMRYQKIYNNEPQPLLKYLYEP